jgi:hypothetical protein
MAMRMNARTIVVDTCHMVILEAPETVAKVIDEAARNALHL